VVVPAFAETTILPELTAHHWRITPLGEGRHAVSVAVAANQSVDGAALAQLAEHLAEQVVWLDLSDQPLTAADLSALSRFTNLNRLQLDGTGVDDTTVARLVKLPHLESLNLYNTSVTDATLDALAQAPQLRRLYLWRTPTTDAGVNRLRTALPGLRIDRGFRFAPLATSAE
jgi:Leucine-rich repeat (LRR) protein